MTNEVIDDAQKQEPGSALVVLYELEYAEGSYLYFYPGGYDDVNVSPEHKVQFRDASGTPQTYEPFPLEVEGFDISSDGSYSRPTVRMANLENTLRTEIGGDFEVLIGKKIVRRTTFQRYLVGEAGDSNPSIELPKQIYIIDRIKSKNVLQVEFELSTPYDLAGIKLPRRIIVGGACPFKYKGARDSLNFYDRVGGCDWDATFRRSSENLFMSRNDEYIVNTTFTVWAGTGTRGEYYSTTETTPEGFYKIDSSGILSAANRVNYWQCLIDTNTSPSDSEKSIWRRVWKYENYSSSNQYDTFKDPRFNEYALNSGVLWQAKKTQDANNHNSLQEGINWTAGDVCGKTLASCRLRFYAIPHETVSGNAVSVFAAKSRTSLPFGGFPGALQRR